MKQTPSLIAVRDETRELACQACDSIGAMCRADGKFNQPIWVKPYPGVASKRFDARLQEYAAAMPKAIAGKAQPPLILGSLRWLFPVPLLELVLDAARSEAGILLEPNTAALGIQFRDLFPKLGKRFQPEAFAFGTPPEAYAFQELVLGAHASLHSFIKLVLERHITIDDSMRICIDSVPELDIDNNSGRRRKRLLLILAILGTEFLNDAFCDLYDGCLVESSKNCGRLLDDFAEILLGMDWDSEQGVKKIAGVKIVFEGHQETILQNARDFLLETRPQK